MNAGSRPPGGAGTMSFGIFRCRKRVAESSDLQAQARSMHVTAFSAALLFATAAAAADTPSDPQILAPADVFKLEWADHPLLSPDGRRVAYERKRFDIMKDRRRSSLWLIDTETGAQR